MGCVRVFPLCMHSVEFLIINNIHLLQGEPMKHIVKYILLYTLLCSECGLFLGAEEPDIEKLSQTKLLK